MSGQPVDYAEREFQFAELLELACELYDFLRPGSGDEMPGEYETWLRAREILGRHNRIDL